MGSGIFLECRTLLPDVTVRSLNSRKLTLQQLGDTLAALPRDTVVILSGFSRDIANQQLSIADSSRFVGEHSAVPVYGVNKNTLGYGIVGGKLKEGYTQGVEAARLAILVMDETPVSSIPVRTESSNRYMFDQRQLRRWGISESLLPRDSVIVERTTTFYQRHTTLVWATVAFIFAQLLVISLLAASILKRRRIQQALRESEERFRTIFEQSRDAISVSVLDHFWYLNPAWAQMFGYGLPSELIGISIYDLIPPESREEVRRRRRDRPLAIPVHDCYHARGLRKDQTAIDTEIRASYFTSHGKTYTLAILRDITTEKRSSEALIESQRQLDIALQAGRMGTWRWDASTNTSTWSPTQESLFGLAPGSYSGDLQDFLDRVHRDDRDAVAEAIAHTIRTGEDYRIIRVIWPDDSRHWVVAHGKVFLDSDGNQKGIIGLTWDVTERRLAEDQIRYQLQLTQAITTHAAESLIMTDEDDRITFVNPAAERTFGWRNEELLGRSFHGTLHHRHPGGSESSIPDCPLIAESRYGEPLQDHEDIFFRKDGEPVDIVCSQTPIMRNQNITGVVMVIHDVTAKKLAARELRRQEEQFRRVFEESPVGMALVSPDHKFQMVNPALTQMVGCRFAGTPGWFHFPSALLIPMTGRPFRPRPMNCFVGIVHDCRRRTATSIRTAMPCGST